MNTFNNFGELENFPICGAGPGGSGAPPTPTEEDDSVYSKQTVKVLFVVSEGEIPTLAEQEDAAGGSLNTEIYLNDLKMKNFKKCTYDFREGTAGQSYIPGFEDIEEPLSLTATELKESNPGTVLAIEPDFTAVRCIITLDSCYYQDRDGNKKKVRTTLNVSVSPTEDGDDFTVQKTLDFTEKSSGAFSLSYRASRPATHTGSSYWRVKIHRTSKDAGEYSEAFPGYDGYIVNKTTWTQAIGLIQSAYKTYPNTALLSLTLKNAIRLGNTMPDVVFRLQGLKVKIPDCYDPIAGTQTSVWTSGDWKRDGLGNIQKAYTANPAWCIYDVLTRTKREGGLGIPETDINRYSFYYLSAICDMLVTTEHDGVETTSRRYEIHNCFDVREPAKNILTYMLALCDSTFGTDELGLLTIIPDAKVTGPSEVVTNADVIDGVFEYSSNNLEDRVSYVNVTYNNPNDRGRTDTVTVPDLSPLQEEINIETRYGYRGADVVLVGCMNKAQAIRKGRWYLYSNSITTGFCSFKTFMRGISLRLGKVINILDSDNQNVAQQGRVVGYEIADGYLKITLDRDVEFGKTPDLNMIGYYCATGYVEKPGFVQWTTSHRIMYVEDTAPVPLIGGIFALFGKIEPTQWRISAVELDAETQIYSITCTQYAEEKYTYIDKNVLTYPPPPIDIQDLETPKVELVGVYKEYYTDALGSHANLVVDWKWPDTDDPNYADWLAHQYEAYYQFRWQRDENLPAVIDNVTQTEFRIENAAPGYYSGRIYAYSPTMLRSDPVDWSFNFGANPGVSDLLAPTSVWTEDYAKGLTVYPGEFVQQDCVILFNYNPANDALPTNPDGKDILFDYLIEVYNGGTKCNTYLCSPITAATLISETGMPGLKGGRFVFDYNKNLETFKRISPYTALRTFWFRIYARDFKGDISATPIDFAVSNAAPVAVPTVEVVRTYNQVRVRLGWGTTPIPQDLSHYVIRMSAGTAGTDADAQNGHLLYRGPSTEVSVPLEDNSIRYFHAAAVDRFGEVGLLYQKNAQVSGYLNGLLETVGAWEDDEVDIADGAPGSDFGRLLISGNLSIPFTSPAYVNVKVGCSFSCCPELRKVRFGLSDGTTQYWKEVYYRSGNDLGARYWSGKALFSNILLPSGSVTFTITTEVKHENGSKITFKDVFQEAEVRLL